MDFFYDEAIDLCSFESFLNNFNIYTVTFKYVETKFKVVTSCRYCFPWMYFVMQFAQWVILHLLERREKYENFRMNLYKLFLLKNCLENSEAKYYFFKSTFFFFSLSS